jgi:hypothetical protein
VGDRRQPGVEKEDRPDHAWHHPDQSLAKSTKSSTVLQFAMHSAIRLGQFMNLCAQPLVFGRMGMLVVQLV